MKYASEKLATVKVRVSDSAVLAGGISLLYAAALMMFPHAFPQLLQRAFEWDYFFPILAAFLVIVNEILFVIISSRRADKPSPFTRFYIAALTIVIVFGFRQLMSAADLETQISHLLETSGQTRDGISVEEVLIYTHMTLVSAVFLPYLLVRATQNYVSGKGSEQSDSKARRTTAGA